MQGLKTVSTLDELKDIDLSNEEEVLELLVSAIWAENTPPLLLGETTDCCFLSTSLFTRASTKPPLLRTGTVRRSRSKSPS
jgi:hypothetical protein